MNINKSSIKSMDLAKAALRLAHTKSNLARHLGVSPQAVAYWIAGRSCMSLKNFESIKAWLKENQKKFPKVVGGIHR